MPPSTGRSRFVIRNVVVWLAMTGILVAVPDVLDRWLPVEVSRFVGWGVACAVWVVAIDAEWQRRVGPIARFGVQLGLWISAALVSIWISELVARP